MRVFLRAVRRLLLSVSFLALVAGLVGLWTYRFERSPGFPVWRLADLRALAPLMPGVEWAGTTDNPILRLRVTAGMPQVAARFSMPGMPAVAMLHLRSRISARGLLPGRELWQDGRMTIEWSAPDGGADVENNLCVSIRHDQQGCLADLVVYPSRPSASPVLRMEHLGRAGELDLADLEITVVQERPIWKIGKWLLALGWLAWGVAYVRSWPGVGRWRAGAASAIALLVTINFVVPGPWKIQHPICHAFQIGDEHSGLPTAQRLPAATEQPPHALPLPFGHLSALGIIPVQEDWILLVKQRFYQVRPLLHVLMLFAPTLVMACFIGRRPTVFLVIMLALATELAQTAFGFGFDLADVFDLTCDACGIALGLWAYGLMEKFKKFRRLARERKNCCTSAT